jgi:hypothetical protein
MVTFRSAGTPPAFLFSGPGNPFIMIDLHICNKTSNLKSFRIIGFRKNQGGEGLIVN